MTTQTTSQRLHLPIRGDAVVIIDAEDFERVFTTEFTDGFVWTGRACDRNWKAQTCGTVTYATSKLGRGHLLQIHRLIASALGNQLVDHKSGNGLENWRDNLRIATCQQNSQNRRKQANALTRFKGVTKKTQERQEAIRYQARIRAGGRNLHLGSFGTEEDAARAYDHAARQHFGEFARLNFPELVTS